MVDQDGQISPLPPFGFSYGQSARNSVLGLTSILPKKHLSSGLPEGICVIPHKFHQFCAMFP